MSRLKWKLPGTVVSPCIAGSVWKRPKVIAIGMPASSSRAHRSSSDAAEVDGGHGGVASEAARRADVIVAADDGASG